MPSARQVDAYSESSLDRVDLLLHASQAAHLVGDGVRAVAWIDEATQTARTIRCGSRHCSNARAPTASTPVGSDEANAAYRRALSIVARRAIALAGKGSRWSRVARDGLESDGRM